MQPFQPKEHYDLNDLVDIVARLRAPNGCPWDRQQTHASLRMAMLEEAYEVADAIDKGSDTMLCEELGDVLLQVVFHARLAAEAGGFTLREVCDGICKKMIYRHPHVFGTADGPAAAAVPARWEELKAAEKGIVTTAQDLAAVPDALPALLRAQKLQKRAARHGFAAQDAATALRGVQQDLAQLAKICAAQETCTAQGTQAVQAQAAQAQAAQAQDTQDRAAQAPDALYGQALLALVNAGRLLGLCAEQALTQANSRFVAQVLAAEQAANDAEGGHAHPDS